MQQLRNILICVAHNSKVEKLPYALRSFNFFFFTLNNNKITSNFDFILKETFLWEKYYFN